jgi:hypothetical protein
MEAFGERKGAGTGIVDLEEQLRKQELDAMMFPKDATVGVRARPTKKFIMAEIQKFAKARKTKYPKCRTHRSL